MAICRALTTNLNIELVTLTLRLMSLISPMPKYTLRSMLMLINQVKAEVKKRKLNLRLEHKACNRVYLKA